MRDGILTINGNAAVFDEIRFNEVNASLTGTYFFFDNVRFNATAVPRTRHARTARPRWRRLFPVPQHLIDNHCCTRNAPLRGVVLSVHRL